MAKSHRPRQTARSRAPSPKGRTSRRGKVRKEFWLDPALLREVRAFLGVATEREAVEMALELVAFRHELVTGARALRGLDLRVPE